MPIRYEEFNKKKSFHTGKKIVKRFHNGNKTNSKKSPQKTQKEL